MKIIKSLVLALSLFSGTVLAQVDSAFEPVTALFSAMSEIDHSGMRAAVTNKFELLENGEVWGIDELVDVVAPSEYKRENFFSLISTDVREDIALISYWNKAIFSSKKSTQNVAWLESVVVIKENGSWRLQQMHSTRVDLKKVPESVVFTEMR